MMRKTNFQRGSVVSPSYLNEIQKSIRFSSAPRADLFSDPTETDELSWDIGSRDGLKDWEVDPRGALGRHAYNGLVLGNDGPLIVYGPPASTRFPPLRDIETQELLGLDSSGTLPTGNYGIVIEAGSMVSPQGEAWSWSRNYFVVNGAQTLYAIFHGLEQQLMLLPQIPSRSLPFCLLSKIVIDPQGLLSVTDLRPNTHTDNLFTYRQALTNTAVIDEDYAAQPWERVMIDASYGNVILQLPDSAEDADEISVVDVYNKFEENPLIIRPPLAQRLQNGAEDIIVSTSGATLELYFHKEANSWRFKSGVAHSVNDTTAAAATDHIKGKFLSCDGKKAIYAAALPGEFYEEPYSLRCGATKEEFISWLWVDRVTDSMVY